MPFHDAYNAEMHLNHLTQRGRWGQAVAAIDEWMIAEPWRTELLLRKALLLRAHRRFEQGLSAVRAYRSHRPEEEDAVFLEIDFLLDMDKAAEAMRALDNLPTSLRNTAQALYYRGRIQLMRNAVHDGLRSLWEAYLRQPGYNRALMEWANIAARYYGKRWVLRQLQQMQLQQHGNRTIAVSVGLAMNMLDTRHGQVILRRAVERYTDLIPPATRGHQLPARRTEITSGGDTKSDAYHLVSEQLLAGHFEAGLDAYFKAVSADPTWMPVLAPLVAEVLVDELVRPEEARLLLEDALRREPTDYRLHVSYTKVFLQLGFGEEALSAANCALALAPEDEKPVALIQRAQAHLLLKEREPAIHDLQTAITRLPDARDVVAQEPRLRPLLRDRRMRDLLGDRVKSTSLWQRVMQWFGGE